MNRKMKFSLNFFVFLSIVSTNNISLAEKYTPHEDGQIQVNCECFAEVGQGICVIKLIDEASGKPRHSWVMTQFVRANKEINLNESCYRKRDVETMGAGICCSYLNNEAKTIEELFIGKKQ